MSRPADRLEPSQRLACGGPIHPLFVAGPPARSASGAGASSGGPRSRSKHAAALSLLLLCMASPLRAGGQSPSWERSEVVSLPAGACQELHVERVGAGLLEIRFFTEPLPRPAGPDLKTSGASLLLASDDLERASLLLYDASGIYQQTARLPGPIRWQRDDSRLCIASGSDAVLCGPVAGEILGTVQIPFGAGWHARITGCAPFPIAERPIGTQLAWLAGFAALAALCVVPRTRRLRDVAVVVVHGAVLACALTAAADPWWLPSVALLPLAWIVAVFLTAAALIEPRRTWIQRIPTLALGSLVLFAVATVPHPVRTHAPADPVVPPLWLDTANWHPRAAHQSLEFRGRRLADVEDGAPVWLVLGGSVAFGEGVEASQTFTAVAQDRLREAGDPTILLNGGAQGWNIQNIDRFLSDFGDALPLSGIVLVSILNNATLPVVAPLDASCQRSLLRATLCNFWRSQLLVPWLKVVLPKPHNADRYRQTLRRLLARELGLGRRVVLLDEASDIEGRRLSLWDIDAYRSIAREVGGDFDLPLHSVSDAIAPLSPGERFLDGIHPTPEMHARIGRRLEEILRAR